MQTEEILTGVYGQLHELLGDHREFKREVLSRLGLLEKEVKEAPGARSARLCALVSLLSGLVSLLGGFGVRLSAVGAGLAAAASAAGGAA